MVTFTKEEMIAALKNGANPDALADNFTDTLNEAMAAIRAEEEAKNNRENNLNMYAEMMLEAIEGYIAAACPEASDIFSDVSAADVRDAIDPVLPMLTAFGSLKNKLEKTEENKSDDDDDLALTDFLAAFGLLS